ncbi:MAG: SAM-dependent methyltransferase, partial [Blastocatellia bacterium]
LLDDIGEQDITASVNFTALIEYGREFGLELVSYESQAEFLMRMGFLDRVALAAASSDNSPQGMKDRLLSKSLLVPGGPSHNFRVLIQRKRITFD